MIRKEDWDAVYRDQIANGQKRLGPPPTFEQVEALSRGQLPEEESEGIRELLSYYPDMMRILTEPFPAADEGGLTDQELRTDLAKILEHVRDSAPPLVFAQNQTSRRWFAIAAGVVVTIALGSIAVWRVASHPRAVLTQVLYPERTRGASAPGTSSATPAHLSKDADYVLEPVFDSPRDYREYRIELLDLATTPPRRVWLRNNVAQKRDSTYPVHLSMDNLDPGLYRLVLYGVDGTVDYLADYTIRIRAK